MTLKFLLPLLLLPALGVAQATGAGTVISNQASASYRVGGMNTAVNSPAAQATVNAVCRAVVRPNGSVTAPGQQVSALPGEQAVFKYQLVNAGNGRSDFGLAARTESGSSFTPTLQVFLDQNGNGQVDAADSQVSSVTLDAGSSAQLLLVAKVTGDTGWAAVNLVASCPGGMQDSDNVARIDVTPPPVLSLAKSFSAEKIRPGETATVTVTARNTGGSAVQDVMMTDLIAAQVAEGLEYLPGSARASGGVLEFTADGSRWSRQEGGSVQGLRLRMATMAPGQQVSVTFGVKATLQAENRTFLNTASLGASYGGGQQAQASLVVKYTPGVALGPLGNPEAPEGSAADSQSRPFAVVGQATCFDHTLKNTGDVRDTFTVTVRSITGAAGTQLLGPDGAPITTPVQLDAGASTTIRVCYTPQTTAPLQATVVAEGARGTRNATGDAITRIESQLPSLVKTVSKPGSPDWTPSDAVTTGDLLSYTLTVKNPYTLPLSNVVVTDPLPAHLDVVTSTGGAVTSGPLDAQTLTWTAGTLQPGETRSYTVTARVSDRAHDDETLRNVFNLTSTEIGTPVLSNAVSAYVWNAAPFIAKSASVPEVAVGDTVTYNLTLKNTSPVSALVDVLVTDTPDAHLQYVPGTSGMDGQPLPDPAIKDGTLNWNVPRLEPGKAVNLSYKLRVLPGASGDLINAVVMVGHGEKARATAIASNRARATTKAKLLTFAPETDLLGTVYLDQDGNGKLGAGESGVAGARVILAGGRLALTDQLGRYHFANVALGTQVLRLDPASVPAQPEGTGTVSVYVQGLTSVDFPLGASRAVTAFREVEIRAGDLNIRKQVVRTEQGYRVTLKISALSAVRLSLSDPLPGDARLTSGRNTFVGVVQPGTTTLEYDFSWSGDPAGAVTDPVLNVGGQP